MPVKRRDLRTRLSPKSGEVCSLEMVGFMVALGSERPVHVLGTVFSLMALEEALTAELFLEKGTVLVKSPFNPGDATSFAHPQLLAHQPDEALIVGHQNHATLKDRRQKALRGALRSAEVWGRVGSVKAYSPWNCWEHDPEPQLSPYPGGLWVHPECRSWG